MSFRPVPSDDGASAEPNHDYRQQPDANEPPLPNRSQEPVLTAEELHALLGDPS